MNLGWTEILLIGGIALLMFGPSRLPGLGKSLGEAIRGFKKGITEDETITQARPVNEQLPFDGKNNQNPAGDTTENASDGKSKSSAQSEKNHS